MSPLQLWYLTNHNGNFCCLNCFHSYSTDSKLIKHYKVCKNHGCYYVEMRNEDNKILKYNHGEGFMKSPVIMYSDLECLLEKRSACQNNPEKSYTEKIWAYTLWLFDVYAMFIWFKKNKPDCYRDKDCMKKFCKDLKEHAKKQLIMKKNDTANWWGK